MQRRAAGPADLTTREAFGVHVLPPWLAVLMREEPELDIELVVTQRTENLLRRDADIAVRFVRPEQDAVIAKRVGQVRLGLFASADYLARHGEPVSITGHLLIGTDRQQPATSPLSSPAAGAVHFRFRTDAVLARLAAIEAGMGIGPVLLPLAAARPQLRRVLAEQVTFPAMEIWLCGHEDLRRSARIRRVYDFLDEKLGAAFGTKTR